MFVRKPMNVTIDYNENEPHLCSDDCGFLKFLKQFGRECILFECKLETTREVDGNLDSKRCKSCGYIFGKL